MLHINANVFAQEDFYQAEPEVGIAIMNQFFLPVCLKEWRDKAPSAANSKTKKLHLRNTLIPMHRRDMIYEEHQMVLQLNMFLKKNRDGKIKERKLDGGNTQKTFIPKEDDSYSTVSTESILFKIIVYAKENRGVAVIDIPNVFIQTRVRKKRT